MQSIVLITIQNISDQSGVTSDVILCDCGMNLHYVDLNMREHYIVSLEIYDFPKIYINVNLNCT